MAQSNQQVQALKNLQASQQAIQDPFFLRLTAMQFAVQWMQGQDGHLVDVAQGIVKFLAGEDNDG